MRWHSFQLHPPGSPPIPEAYRERIEASRPLLAKRAKEQYGLDLHPGPLETDSRPALIGEKYAAAQGKGKEYHDAVMRAYWQQALPINNVAVLKEIAAGSGLDAEQFAAALTEPQYEQEVEADIAQAEEYGLRAVPALIFDEHYLVEGAQPYEILRRVVEKVESEQEGEKS